MQQRGQLCCQLPAHPPFSHALQGYNKRATVYYLLHRYQEAIDDCNMALHLNPYHFGAASGLGLCHWSLKQSAAALQAFERALEIHPGLTSIRGYVETLREEVARGPKRREDGGDG
jgi:tetratricopeptide (TPR) repeat protein